MNFQTAMLVSIAVLLGGGAIYYFNQEEPEHRAMTRVGLAILTLGFLLLIATVAFLRQWSAH